MKVIPVLTMLMIPLAIGLPARGATVWNKTEHAFYKERRFIQLEQDLAGQGEWRLLHDIQNQESDLKGCRALHHGDGGVLELAQCLRFISRENKLNLFSPGRTNMVRDLNVLCPRMIVNRKSVEILAKAGMDGVLSPKEWRPCLEVVWKQVYLTAYANFEADPVGTVAFVRRVQTSIPPDDQWKKKTIRLLDAHE